MYYTYTSAPPVSPYARDPKNWYWHVDAHALLYKVNDNDFHFYDPKRSSVRQINENNDSSEQSESTYALGQADGIETNRAVPIGGSIPQQTKYVIPRHIEKTHNERHRYYHSAWHLRLMFATAERLGIELIEEEQLAILWHDYVYYPGFSDNEEASCAAFLLDFAHNSPSIHKAVSSRLVCQIIAATQNHFNRDAVVCARANLILDLDLAAFALPRFAFLASEQLVWLEYRPALTQLPKIKPTQVFALKRKQLLEKILHGGSIYRTPVIRDALEDQARRNLKSVYGLSLR